MSLGLLALGQSSRLITGYPRRLFASSVRRTPQRDVPHLVSMSALSIPQVERLIASAAQFKAEHRALQDPVAKLGPEITEQVRHRRKTLQDKTIAVIFSKRSTRTRVATESAVKYLGGHPMFLGSADIQLGVNESLYDSARVISSMVDGIMARVAGHEEIEMLAKTSSVPVINALSDQFHPTQILADIQVLLETFSAETYRQLQRVDCHSAGCLRGLSGLKLAWVGDANNILFDMLGILPRLGIAMHVATPKGYAVPEHIKQLVSDDTSAVAPMYTTEPLEAVKDANIVVTDTWISMGQESQKAQRLKEFAGYQITRGMLEKGGAHPEWKFMHCLPRKSEEVSDDVFYDSARSLVWEEAENRRHTIAAVMDSFVGRRDL